MLFISNACWSQEDVMNEPPPDIKIENPRKGDIRYMLTHLITKNAEKRTALADGPENYAYFFSITLSFDDAGKIDNVYFSKNRPKNVTDLLSLNESLIKKIKEQNLVFRQYASKLVLIPFFYHGHYAKTLDYSSGFLKSIENLLPVVDYPMSKKSWIILDTMVNTFAVVH